MERTKKNNTVISILLLCAVAAVIAAVTPGYLSMRKPTRCGKVPA